MSGGTDGEELVEVRLVGLPVEVHRKVAEHGDAVNREFALLGVDPGSAPARLLALGEELQAQYGGFTAQPSEELQRAMEARLTQIDLVYRVPRSAADAADDLARVLDEVDEFCEQGDLLTLATPEEGRAYRRWFLGEFIDQLTGAPPTPWSEWASRNPS